jgi:hypothetical protein
VTFQRLVQSSIEDMTYAQRIGRLRDFYLAVVPELGPYLLVVRGPHAEALLHDKGLSPSNWQLTLTTAGMVAVVNSIVIGACAGLVVENLIIASLAIAFAGGGVVAATTLSLQRAHHRRAHDAYTPEAIDRLAIFVPAEQAGMAWRNRNATDDTGCARSRPPY